MGAGAYVGWNIGANDTANCIGTSVGCGLIRFKQAVALVAIFATLGAVLQGDHVMKTIGKGIVKEDLDYIAIFVALLCSGFFVTLATFFKIPVSTSQAIVGGGHGHRLCDEGEDRLFQVHHHRRELDRLPASGHGPGICVVSPATVHIEKHPDQHAARTDLSAVYPSPWGRPHMGKKWPIPWAKELPRSIFPAR